jgi:hypothetical protein
MKLVPLALAILLAAAVGISLAHQPAAQPTEPARRGPEPNQMGQRIVEGLKNSPGCVGVDSATTQSGRNVIFAWFENKAAAMAWYNSPTHAFMRKSFVDPTGLEREPMAGVPDDVPILTIASLKFIAQDSPDRLPGLRIPLSEIAIEMYTTLPGGIRYGGGFTPQAIPVQDRLTLDSKGNLLTDTPAPAEANQP